MRDLGVIDFVMYVHPFVDAYLKKGLISLYRRWRMELGVKFRIIPSEDLAYLQYRVLDANHNEIDLKEEKDLDKSSTVKTKTKAKTRANQE